MTNITGHVNLPVVIGEVLVNNEYTLKKWEGPLQRPSTTAIIGSTLLTLCCLFCVIISALLLEPWIGGSEFIPEKLLKNGRTII
jgi:hypothetical protein